MTKPINDFSDAKVGDKVTCYHLGHGEIIKIFDSARPAPILCSFDGGRYRRGYRTDGSLNPEDAGPMLFKGHVEFPDPIPVKIKVKKTMYTNVYLNKELSECYRLDVYPSETIEDADIIVGKNTKDWVATAEVKFEVEE